MPKKPCGLESQGKRLAGDCADRQLGGRRRFLKTASLLAVTAGFHRIQSSGWAAESSDGATAPRSPFVGVHIAAHSFYDEGLDHCLDFLQEAAGVNTLFVTSNSYYGAMLRPKEAQGYHGVPIRDGRDRQVTKTFFQPHEKYYASTALRHKPLDSTLQYAGREVFADLAEPAQRRGLKIYRQTGRRRCSPEYVYREPRRAVDGVAGESAIYAGLAIDVPRGADWGTEPSPSDPDEVGRCVRRAYDAGASGIVICREYEEMHEASLRAIGQAVRERAAG